MRILTSHFLYGLICNVKRVDFVRWSDFFCYTAIKKDLEIGLYCRITHDLHGKEKIYEEKCVLYKAPKEDENLPQKKGETFFKNLQIAQEYTEKQALEFMAKNGYFDLTSCWLRDCFEEHFVDLNNPGFL